MPAIAALTLADGQGTPVNHTFSPLNASGQSASWIDRSATTIAGARTISNEVRTPAVPGGAQRNIWTFKLPIEAVGTNGSTTVVGFSSCKVEFNFRQEATLQEMKDAYAYVKNLFAVAAVKTGVEGMEPHY